jgi:alkylation response protein AidB-like acyl-CoA dehydrogenase
MFGLTEEQQQLQREVRTFAAREIAPHVSEWDEASRFPSEVVKKLGAMGLLGVIFPESLGGAGLGYVEYVLAIEELSRVDGSIGMIVAAHNSLCTNHIMLGGNDEQRQRWIPRLARGEWLGCWGLTEPGSGSDAGGARTTAVRHDDGWVLNGSKTFITNGSYADCAVVLAVTDREKSTHGGISAFVVEKGTKGFRPGKKENKLGMRASDTAELIFEECWVPAENLIGEEGGGFRDAMRVLPGLDCGAGTGDWAWRTRCGAPVCDGAEAVWEADQRVSGDPVQAGHDGDGAGCGVVADDACGANERRRAEGHDGSEHGEAVRERGGVPHLR